MRPVSGVMRRFCIVTLGAAVRALKLFGARQLYPHAFMGISGVRHSDATGEEQHDPLYMRGGFLGGDLRPMWNTEIPIAERAYTATTRQGYGPRRTRP